MAPARATRDVPATRPREPRQGRVVASRVPQTGTPSHVERSLPLETLDNLSIEKKMRSIGEQPL